MRILSASGAAFALLPVPAPDLHGRVHGDRAVDIELLTPDRLVRYLGRALSPSFIEELAEFWWQCASETHPELTTGGVDNPVGGVALHALTSSDTDVRIEVTINADLKSEIAEFDGASFDCPRASLVDAAHELREWLL